MLLLLLLACSRPSTWAPAPSVPSHRTAARTTDVAPPARLSRVAAPTPADTTALLDPHTPGDRLLDLGRAAWSRGDLETAWRLLERAPRDADVEHALADVLATLHANGQPCEHGATLDGVLDHLEASVAQAASERERIAVDPALEEVRRTTRYQVLLGADLSDATVLRALLPLLSFTAPPSGVLPAPATLVFAVDGTASRQDRTLADDGTLRTAAATGRWEMLGDKVSITFGEATALYTLTPDGTLQNESGDAWKDVPVECGA